MVIFTLQMFLLYGNSPSTNWGGSSVGLPQADLGSDMEDPSHPVPNNQAHILIRKFKQKQVCKNTKIPSHNVTKDNI
jgi:hypothetical protein